MWCYRRDNGMWCVRDGNECSRGVTDVGGCGCGVTDVTTVRGVSEMVMSVPGVPRLGSALRLLSTCLATCSVAVSTGTMVSLVSATCRPVNARSGPATVACVFNTTCVAGAHSLTIRPSADASTAISPVFPPLITFAY